MSLTGQWVIKMWVPQARLVHPEMFDADGNMIAPPPPPPTDRPIAPPMPEVTLKDYGQPTGDFFEGELLLDLVAQPDGTLTGTAGFDPIYSGYYTGDEFFKVDVPAGPGRWEIWCRVDAEGNAEGMVSVGGGKGFPNFAYGKKV